MKSNKRTIQRIVFWLGMLFIGSHASIATAAESSANVRISAIFVAPTCELRAPSTVILEQMIPGKTYINKPFDIQMSCTSAANTSIYAQHINGSLMMADTVRMELLTGSTIHNNRRVQFSLQNKADRQKITLNGVRGSVFCKGNNSRACTLTPITMVPIDAPLGFISTVIQFNIRYES